MSHLAILLLLLDLLTAPTPPREGTLPFGSAMLSSGSGWEMDPNGSPIPEPSSDSGWEFDPNG